MHFVPRQPTVPRRPGERGCRRPPTLLAEVLAIRSSAPRDILLTMFEHAALAAQGAEQMKTQLRDTPSPPLAPSWQPKRILSTLRLQRDGWMCGRLRQQECQFGLRSDQPGGPDRRVRPVLTQRQQTGPSREAAKPAVKPRAFRTLRARGRLLSPQSRPDVLTPLHRTTRVAQRHRLDSGGWMRRR